jgi:uncharacterized OB-fold protein
MIWPLLPPSLRSRKAQGLTLAAAIGRFALQCCAECGRYSYPPRDACPRCLSADLPFIDAPASGLLLSETCIRVTSDPYYREHMPWRVGLVQLDCGPSVVTHLHGDSAGAGSQVRLSLQLDKSGQAVFFAGPTSAMPPIEDDRQWHEIVADPKHRHVLITDGRNPVALQLAVALRKARASTIHIGVADCRKPFDEQQQFEAINGVEIVDFDPASEGSLRELATDLGAKVDILINTADDAQFTQLFDAAAADTTQEVKDLTVTALIDFAQSFGPAMRGRASKGAPAWINLLSVDERLLGDPKAIERKARP